MFACAVLFSVYKKRHYDICSLDEQPDTPRALLVRVWFFGAVTISTPYPNANYRMFFVHAFHSAATLAKFSHWLLRGYISPRCTFSMVENLSVVVQPSHVRGCYNTHVSLSLYSLFAISTCLLLLIVHSEGALTIARVFVLPSMGFWGCQRWECHPTRHCSHIDHTRLRWCHCRSMRDTRVAIFHANGFADATCTSRPDGGAPSVTGALTAVPL